MEQNSYSFGVCYKRVSKPNFVKRLVLTKFLSEPELLHGACIENLQNSDRKRKYWFSLPGILNSEVTVFLTSLCFLYFWVGWLCRCFLVVWPCGYFSDCQTWPRKTLDWGRLRCSSLGWFGVWLMRVPYEGEINEDHVLTFLGNQLRSFRWKIFDTLLEAKPLINSTKLFCLMAAAFQCAELTFFAQCWLCMCLHCSMLDYILELKKCLWS